MATAKKAYARYYIVRENEVMWGGDPAVAGTPFRQFVITSNEFVSTLGTFQVYGLEAASGGIKDGRLTTSGEPSVVFDKDFDGLNAAVKQFEELTKAAEKVGLQRTSMMQILEFEDKLRRARGGA
jgi:hypothetical protein